MSNLYLMFIIEFALSFNLDFEIKLIDIEYNPECKSIRMFKDLQNLTVGDSIVINFDIIENSGYLYIENSGNDKLLYGNSIDPQNIITNPNGDSLVYNYDYFDMLSASNQFEPYSIMIDYNNRELTFYVYDTIFVEWCKLKWDSVP